MSPPFRLLPRLDPENEFFWTSGRDGRLRFLRCRDCGYYVHPPGPVCPRCLTRTLAPHAVSGLARLHTFTVNHQAWSPDIDEPYVIGIVELPEQEGLRLTTNVVNIAPADVTVDMPLRVVFEDRDPVFVPLFEPDGAR